MKALYYDSRTAKITDENGQPVTTEQARKIVESGEKFDCSQSFQRLVSFDYDVNALDQFYRDMDAK